ncbi:MAG TPA: heme lyase CcmF/NrfE family subunit, partial [Acidobacteriota bacterium]|nr:heme lyase CcmF/NrfE family subunit [Acidobacteriota bacterium]
HYTSTTLPLAYKITAFWGGQAGSLLFWLLILSMYTLIALMQNQNKNRHLMPYVTATLMSVTLFFLSMVCFAADPFAKLSPIPIEGQSLNPLLQNYWMVSHPPSLYTGYVGVTVPFAFAMAALITGKLDVGWLKAIRKWTLFAWLFLTLGILQGSYWAYIELGWGGYWAWDPVENASLMPWLASTAFLHSVMVQEKKGMLKIWNMVLVITSFTLAIFGTFLTRSGVVSSVHSFAQSPIGKYFVVFLAIQIAVSIGYLVYRRKELRPEAKLESFVSRESSFLFNNIFFLVICLAVLLGTTFPIISEWVTGSKVTVGAPFFNKVVTPFAIGLVLLTGICPLIAWRKAGLNNLKRNFLVPTLLGTVAVAFLFAFGITHFIALLFFFSAVFVLATVYFEFSKGTQARMAMIRESAPAAFYHLVQRNSRRYGGFIIHTGMAVLIIGIAASSFFSLEKDAMVQLNQSIQVRGYQLIYRDIQFHQDPHKEVVRAKIEVIRNGKPAGFLVPERHFYKNSDQPTTEVALRSFWNEDLYIIIAGWDEQGQATFKVYVNPLISWLWWGGFIMLFGGIIVLSPSLGKEPALATAPQAAEEVSG